ncbi:conjugal transfer protein TraG N-terminal domain-containing protein [Ferrovum myxofaciens]|uniref:Conjugal transfer protein TraG N-terminal domain-containing protein n=2 Tax=Ferrovum myxofaciens TaxID=416213 RepID=A0A9E6MWM7_9PROT|nr:conjugal transfer protein TraG N-terminal domain-containing protein [Ferrovum myxofaciens]QKE37367.1 MAG: conjugal transfer protein TraG N-terminal domain-containing protein [Ferrovum myxofaciens]QWY77761.1 MAG: conjugal transfer protein TraG N-terminal domain-containing protein [Ferrovum myxofaciens]
MFTFYVYGDVYMFYNVLNAVAMVFNSSIFNLSTGAGAFLTGGLISLIWITFGGMFQGNATFRPAVLMSLFVFFYAGVNVKETVDIEDVFTGTISAVSNVPLFVAGPAGLISAAAHGITQNIETAFTTPAPGNTFTSLSLGSEGFGNPLRLLMALRCGSSSGGAGLGTCPVKSFPYVTRSLQLFLLFCAQPNSNFTQAAFESSTNLVTYLTGLPSLAGLTTYYSTTYPNGVGMDCSTAGTDISSDVANIFSGSGANATTLNNVIYEGMIGSEPIQTKPSSWGQWTTTDITTSFNSITNGASAQMHSQGAQSYMENQMFMDSLDNTFKCSSSIGSINDFNACISAITQRDALESMKVDDAAAGSIFARTMFPAMNLLLMLFYGFSPLVALVAMMSVANGLKVVMSYFLFGAWTQSWLPVAAIINYYMQMLAGQAAASTSLNVAGLAIVNSNAFYDSLGMKIALGANMLAATPMLTMALLSGSMFAMTGAVSAIGGKDKVDENLAAPALAQGNAVTQVGSANKFNSTNTTETSGNLGLGAAMNPAFSELSVDGTQMAETGEKRAIQQSQQATETSSKAIDKALTQITGKGNAYDAARAHDQQVKNTDTSTYQTAHAITDAVTSDTGISVQDKEAVAGKIEAEIQAGANLGSLLKLAKGDVLSLKANAGGSLSYNHEASDTLSRKIDQNIKDSSNQQTSWQHSMAKSEGSGSGEHFRATLEDKLGKTETEKFGTTITAVNSASKNLEKAESTRASIGVGAKLNGLQMMNAAVSNPEYTNAASAIDQRARETGQSGLLDNYRKGYIAMMGVSPDADAQTHRLAYDVATVMASRQLPGELQAMGEAPMLDTLVPGIARNFRDNHQAIQGGGANISSGNDALVGQVHKETSQVPQHVNPANTLKPGSAAAAGANIHNVPDGSGTYKGTAPTDEQQSRKFREDGHDFTIQNLNPSGIVGTAANVVLPGDGDRSNQAAKAQDNDWNDLGGGIATDIDGPGADEPGLEH